MKWWGPLLLLGLLAIAAWLAWPSAKAPLLSAHTDAGSRADANQPTPTDPTATSAIDITARGAVLIAMRSKGFRRTFAAEHALLNDVPLGAYEVFATGPEGSANAKATVTLRETAYVELKLAALPGAVALRGTVRDIVGGTVPGAEVWVPPTIARTDATGQFEAYVMPGDHEVRVRAAGYAEATARVSLHIDHRIDLVLHPAATLRGVVVHADGAPAGGARLIVSGNDAFDTLADAEGKFTFEGLAGGSFEVRASTASEIGIADHVAIAPGEMHDVRIELTSALAIFGRVIGADSAVIAGAKVILEGERHVTEAETTSAADGSYRFSPVLPGAVTVRACADGYLCSAAPSRYYVKTPASPLDVILGAGSVLRLHIVDASGAPVANAHAYLGDFEGCESGDDGECVIDHLRARRTNVTADHPTAGHVSDEPLDVGPGETRHTVRLVRGGTVRGTVRWDDGKPAANIEVTDGLMSTRSSTHTGSDGRYELTNVETSFAHIRAQVSERTGELVSRWTEMDPSGAAERTLELAPGEVREGVDFVVRRDSKTISGTVVDATGAPLANAAVGLLKEREFFDGTHEYGFMFEDVRTYAAADGTFTVENVADAEYIVWATAPDEPRGLARHVKAGSQMVLVKMPAGVTIEGTIKDERGAPVTRFDLRVDPSRNHDRQRIFDATGHFTVKGLAAGVHDIAVEGATDENGATCLIKVDAKSDEASHVTCTLAQSVTVTARIVAWPDGRPVPGVQLTADGTVRRESEPSDADGRIRIESVGVGESELHSFDVLGHGEKWHRKVGRTNPFDIGDLMVSEQRGYVSMLYVVRVTNMEILSIDGQDVTKLGDNSLYGVLDAAREGAPIVGKKPNGETTTVFRPPHRRLK